MHIYVVCVVCACLCAVCVHACVCLDGSAPDVYMYAGVLR